MTKVELRTHDDQGELRSTINHIQESVPSVVESLPDSLRADYELIGEKSQMYGERARDIICRARDLAVVAHCLNTNNQARYRRNVRDGDSPSPEKPLYIAHQFEITKRFLGETISYPVGGITGQTGVIHNARQDAYDPRLVASALLHDFIEDVEGVEGLGELSINARRMLIQSYLLNFEDSSPEDQDFVDDVCKIVWAVTKPTDAEYDDLVPQIDADPGVHSDIEYFTNENVSDPSTVSKHMIDAVITVHTLLERTSGNDWLRLAAIALKNEDGNSNMWYPGSKPEKLYRAHIYGEIARVLGLPIASLVALGLLQNRYSILDRICTNSITDAQRNMVSYYVQLENERASEEHSYATESIAVLNHNVAVKAHQIPLITVAEQRNQHIAPAVQLLCPVDDKSLIRNIYDSPGDMYGVYKNQIVRGSRVDTELFRRINALRTVAYYSFVDVDSQDGQTVFICRFTDSQPTGHDALKYRPDQDTNDIIRDVPEIALLGAHDGDVSSTLRWLEWFSPLTSR